MSALKNNDLACRRFIPSISLVASAPTI